MAVHGVDVHFHVASALDFQRPRPHIVLLNEEQVSAVPIEILVVFHSRIRYVSVLRAQSKVRPEFFLRVHVAVRRSGIVKDSVIHGEG